MWEPPLTVGVISNLTYHLTVTNMNTGVMIINTNTTETRFTVGTVIKLCTRYTASVTAFSQSQKGDTENIIKETPGSEL